MGNMNAQITWWFDLPNKVVINLKNKKFPAVPFSEINDLSWQIHCDSDAFYWLQCQGYKKESTDNSVKVGEALFRLRRGGTSDNLDGNGTKALKLLFQLCPEFPEEHPSDKKEWAEIINPWDFPPRFENCQEGIFSQVSEIDIKACHATIMRDYPLPYGESIHIKDSQLIEQKLKEGANGFVRFYLRLPATIKNKQIPFIPNYDANIKSSFKGRLLLYTRLFHTFQKQYKIKGKIYYTDLWIFPERKGDANAFLDHCAQLGNQGKILRNSLYGVLGKNSFSGYKYHAWMVAINHLAILQTYKLCRQFKPEQVLAIRSDCIYVQGELPAEIAKKTECYRIKKHNLVGFKGKESLYKFDQDELKARYLGELERKELVEEFLKEKLEKK
jgi:hypothetical protein